MSKEDLGASSEPTKVGPDCFSFYTREVEKLLSLNGEFLPLSLSQASESSERTCGHQKDIIGHTLRSGGESNSGSGSFSQAICSEVSEFKRERLKSLLQQTVVSLSQEVDDMLDPVLAIRQLQSQLRLQRSVQNHSVAPLEVDVLKQPKKKIRLSSLSSSESDDEIEDADLNERDMISNSKRSCAFCHTTRTPMWRTCPEVSKYVCNACGIRYKKKKLPKFGYDQNTGSCQASTIEDNTLSKEGDDDVKFLLQNNTASVESSVKKYSDELLSTLEQMEGQLEGLLDLLQSSNRLMTLTEKQQLQKLIQKLPPRNLDRVVEIIQRDKSLPKQASDAILVNLDEEDNVTLWRLYIYVKAVENAKKLSGWLEKPK